MGSAFISSAPWIGRKRIGGDDARMESVFRYLRGAKGLCLGDLRPLFPTEI